MSQLSVIHVNVKSDAFSKEKIDIGMKIKRFRTKSITQPTSDHIPFTNCLFLLLHLLLHAYTTISVYSLFQKRFFVLALNKYQNTQDK